MLEIGLLNIDDRQYNIENDDDSRVDENGKRHTASNIKTGCLAISFLFIHRIYGANDCRLHERSSKIYT